VEASFHLSGHLEPVDSVAAVTPVAAILPLMMPAPRLASIKRRHIESTQNNCFLNGFLYWQRGERTGSWTWRKAHKFKASPPPYIMDPQLPPG